MDVTFTLKPDDLWSFTKHLYRSRRSYWVSRFPLLFLPVMLWSIAVRADFSPGWSWIFALTITVLALALIYFSIRHQAVKVAKEQPALLKEQTLTISPEGLRSRTAVGEGSVIWAGVHSVDEDRQHIYILISKNTGYIIPKDAFAGPEGAHEFAALAQEYLQKRSA